MKKRTMFYTDWLRVRERLWLWSLLAGILAVVAGLNFEDAYGGFISNLLAELAGWAFITCIATVLINHFYGERNRLLREVRWQTVLGSFEGRLRSGLIELAVAMLYATGKRESLEDARQPFFLGGEPVRFDLFDRMRREFLRPPQLGGDVSAEQAAVIWCQVEGQLETFGAIWSEFATHINALVVSTGDYHLLSSIHTISKAVSQARDYSQKGEARSTSAAWPTAHSLLYAACRGAELLEFMAGYRDTFDESETPS